MLNLRSLFFTLFIGTSLTGCVSASQSLTNLQQTTPNTFTLPVNYIDAYVNATDYYLKCVAKEGVPYPVVTTVNGSTIRTMSKTPDTIISKELNREQKTANMSVYIGSHAYQLFSMKELDEQSTQVSHFSKKAGLRSDNFNQENQDKQINLFKAVSTNKVHTCIDD